MTDAKDKSDRYRRPGNFGGRRQDVEPPKPPVMARSRTQLATAYAPGVLFTWEGGKGICRSVPVDRELKLDRTTNALIFESMREFISNWRARIATTIPDALDDLSIDRAFYDTHSGRVQIDPARFRTTSPDVVGYVPYPLIYRCGTCGRVREYQSVEEQARSPLPRTCQGHHARWTQIDVVYVHWSGNVEPLSPFNYNPDRNTGEVRQIRSCGCGSDRFVLRNEAPVFKEWRFICEGCKESRTLKKADPEVLQRLHAEQQAGGRQFQYLEVNMMPVSYRANSAFYPQRSAFIKFSDPSVVDLMTGERTSELLRVLARVHNVPFNEPAREDIENAVRQANRGGEWDEFADLETLAERAAAGHRDDAARRYRDLADTIREQWFADKVVSRGKLASPALMEAVVARQTWARRYDPIRLTIQHHIFEREHIEEAKTRHAAIDVLEPDITLSEVANDPAAKARYAREVGGLLHSTGIDRMVLIRGLPICEFSFGYSRVSSSPIYQREHNGQSIAVPVRLKAFDTLPHSHGRHPIYVTEQNNEALYVKLDEDRVRRWLERNLITDMPTHDVGIGRAYLEGYEDFGPFLEAYKDRERGRFDRRLAPYIYLLLHSLSHQLMHSLAEVSGLDRDGIGEHIFPADLAFVIYRKGMTPDLGNVSAMWRNHALEFLRRIVDQRMLRCGSGSLCDARGGACPACIMVSEVSCISSNLLLSRSSLKGGAKPEWEDVGAPDLIGYFDPGLDA
ncbi:hypothetical protein [Brevundimonas poindexterae]|uniref:hypothetical protein n=1 Tax=Brevundimonas poindexterae TaxID=74325 RepID=UPI001CFD6E2D|nr:hypothetical protein [Brevundimonas poindexterae]